MLADSRLATGELGFSLRTSHCAAGAPSATRCGHFRRAAEAPKASRIRMRSAAPGPESADPLAPSAESASAPESVVFAVPRADASDARHSGAGGAG